MRVVLLITDLEPGGTPLRMARLARLLRQAGVDVAVGCLAPPGPVSASLEASGVSTFACHARGPADLRALCRLRVHLRRRRPQLVHSCLLHANVAARLVCAALRIPTIGSTATIEVQRRWHIWLERITARRDAAHIVHSQALARHVQHAFRLPPDRVHVVPASIDPPMKIDRESARRTLGLPANAFVLATAGRFDPVKRLHLLIAAAPILAHEQVVLALAGDGPENATLRTLADRSPARSSIRFLGWQPDLSTLLSAADAFALVSRTEGMPNALLEALAAGLPVIASDMPALRNTPGLAECLLLVSPAPDQTPGAIADALRRLRAAPDLAPRLTQRAQQWTAANLDPHATLKAVIDVYARVLAAGRS